MKIHRFIGDFNLNNSSVVMKDKNIVHQMRNVLKFHLGERVVLSDGKGNEALSEIKLIQKNEVKLSILEKRKNKNESERRVSLFCSILKKDNFELVAEKATEVGVSEIIPIISDRTVKKNINFERVRKIMREAAEQSGRGVIPVLHSIMSFKDAIKIGSVAPTFLMDISGNDDLSSLKKENCVNIFIGPEGGWTDNEKKIAKENDVFLIKLGELTLRAETAAIISSFLCSSSFIK